MAFESLSEKLQNTFKKLKGKGVLTEADINDAMREVKLALLEADVNFKIVKEFVAEVKEKCLGQEVLQSLTPGQQVIKIVKRAADRPHGRNRKQADLLAQRLHRTPHGRTSGNRKDNHLRKAGDLP